MGPESGNNEPLREDHCFVGTRTACVSHTPHGLLQGLAVVAEGGGCFTERMCTLSSVLCVAVLSQWNIHRVMWKVGGRNLLNRAYL